MAADRGATAIGTLAYQRRPEAPALPVRLAPRPAMLTGREALLTDLGTRHELAYWTGQTEDAAGPRDQFAALNQR